MPKEKKVHQNIIDLAEIKLINSEERRIHVISGIYLVREDCLIKDEIKSSETPLVGKSGKRYFIVTKEP